MSHFLNTAAALAAAALLAGAGTLFPLPARSLAAIRPRARGRNR
jgi:hypothetical protein